jgi:hypothetical protein
MLSGVCGTNTCEKKLKSQFGAESQVVYKLEVQQDRGGPLHDFFRSSELAELPPKLRAIFEENKVREVACQQLLCGILVECWSVCLYADHEREAAEV